MKKQRREDSNKIRNEREDIIKDSSEIKRIIRTYYKQTR